MQITKENRVLMKFIEIQEYSERFSQKRDQKGTTFLLLPEKSPSEGPKTLRGTELSTLQIFPECAVFAKGSPTLRTVILNSANHR